jgi:hypothetical protein
LSEEYLDWRSKMQQEAADSFIARSLKYVFFTKYFEGDKIQDDELGWEESGLRMSTYVE